MDARPARSGLGVETRVAGNLGTRGALGIPTQNGEVAHRILLPRGESRRDGFVDSHCKPLAKYERASLPAQSAPEVAATAPPDIRVGFTPRRLPARRLFLPLSASQDGAHPVLAADDQVLFFALEDTFG